MLNRDRLFQLLSYEPETGHFRWLVQRPSAVAKVGAIAGRSARDGRHAQIKIDGRLYLAHRLAWLYVYGEWPTDQIDHINGDRYDNRITNLRLATHKQNCANKRPRGEGLKGTSRHRDGRWQARIGNQYLGLFDTAELAHAAYREKAHELYGEFARCA